MWLFPDAQDHAKCGLKDILIRGLRRGEHEIAAGKSTIPGSVMGRRMSTHDFSTGAFFAAVQLQLRVQVLPEVLPAASTPSLASVALDFNLFQWK
jgi:hypothetical protein